MARELKIRDLTLRDGQQSAFATRLNQNQVERVLPYYKDAAFYAMEVWGGAVPDSVMRFLGENPWYRLESIKKAVGDVSYLTALSRGRNLFGYAPYGDDVIEGFSRNAIESGLGIMRIFDALNDVDNVKSTIKYIKKYGGIADCAVCYTVDPKYPKLSFFDKLKGKKNPAPVFTDDYFVGKAKELAALGADMITIKDMSGLIPPKRVYNLIKAIKANVSIPVDFHTHCTPGYGLASVVAAIAAGVDIVDTNIWNFAGGPAAPALELVYIFAGKMDVKLGVNMEAVAKINAELLGIRKELEAFDAVKQFPKPFNPLTDTIPAEIEAQFDRAVKAAYAVDEETLIDACHKIEDYFGFPKPNELVQKAEIPGGMYTNMVAQLKGLKSEHLLEPAMKLIPSVRLDAGLPPLVTPTSQIVGSQAVSCAIALEKGKDKYATTSTQFVNLVKGEYGRTPVEIDPEFRLKIAGTREAIPYDTSKNQRQPNPVLENAGGVKLAENEKEELLLELFPAVAKDYLTKVKTERYAATKPAEAPKAEEKKVEEKAAAPAEKVSGKIVAAPLPGKVVELCVKVGDAVKAGQKVAVLEAMKMENDIPSEHTGVVKQILVAEGDTLQEGQAILVIEDAKVEAPAAPAAPVAGKKVAAPLPGKVLEICVKVGDEVKSGQKVAVLEAMKMENDIPSEYSGVVRQILVAEGDTLQEGQAMFIVE